MKIRYVFFHIVNFMHLLYLEIVLNKQPLHNKFYLIDHSGQKCPFLRFSKFSKFTNPFSLFKILEEKTKIFLFLFCEKERKLGLS